MRWRDYDNVGRWAWGVEEKWLANCTRRRYCGVRLSPDHVSNRDGDGDGDGGYCCCLFFYAAPKCEMIMIRLRRRQRRMGILKQTQTDDRTAELKVLPLSLMGQSRGQIAGVAFALDSLFYCGCARCTLPPTESHSPPFDKITNKSNKKKFMNEPHNPFPVSIPPPRRQRLNHPDIVYIEICELGFEKRKRHTAQPQSISS